MRSPPAAAALLVLAALGTAAQNEPPKLRLEKGDRICIIGNTLAERMQHDGWLETFLQSRFPAHELVVRNLGYSGDELTVRLRSAGFGSPDQHLAAHKADVILAFFGYNESFGGPAGLDKFRKDLADFVRKTLAQKYNGKSAPRLVLFSPIAHEDLRSPDLPDGRENNRRIELYAQAMAGTARARDIPFVDLFALSQKLYAAARAPLTINGIHLHDAGNEMLASAIDRDLFGDAPAPRESGTLEKLRQAILDKNFHWFHRYRTTDGYSTYGGRADLKFTAGQTNRVVLQRELEVLDVMTANRDRRIWAAAQGGDLGVDDANAPPFVPVVTNRPGQGAGGLHPFLGGDLAVTRMQPGKGMKVNLYASEEKFPELANPVQMAWDTRNRLWVAAWPSYPHWKPREKMDDRLLILEDADGDGRADRCKTFAGGLHNPTGFEFWNGGVLVAQVPDLLFLRDTDGDDRADLRVRLVNGIDSADTHHAANSFVFDPGGGLYFQEGTFHHSQVETPYGPPVRCANAGVFRYEPRTHKFETYVSFGFANPHGHVFDRWGMDFVTDGTTEETYDAILFSGRTDFPRKHAKPPRLFQARTRPCAGTEILSSRHFPDENQGNLLLANVIGFLGILQYRISEKGAGFAAAEVEPLVFSTDPNFRPSDIEVGPDGAVYFTDWHNPIIGHMQHNLRDPSRDKTHGRVYRLTYMDRPLLKPAAIAGQPVDKLLDLLKEPENRVRYRAKIELSARPTADVIAALRAWTAGLEEGDPDREHHLLEALWVHQGHNVVNEDLLRRMLRSPEPRARAAATRVLRYWRDRVAGPLALLRVQAADEHPRVRLEAVVTASYFPEAEAALVALEALRRERDPFIDLGLKETMAALDPVWRPALREGRLALPADNPAAVDYLVAGAGAADLAKLPRTPGVHLAILTKHGVGADQRREALRELAKAQKKDDLALLLDTIARGVATEHGPHVMEELGRLLVERPDLPKERDRLRALATGGASAEARRIAFAAWTLADGSADEAFASASKEPSSLRDFLDGIPLVGDAKLRESLYPRIRPLLSGAPAGAPGETARGVKAEYLPGVPQNAALETLAAMAVRAAGVAPEFTLDLPIVAHRDRFALRFTGSIHVPKDGAWTFYTSSDDGSRLYLDGRLVVDNDGWHGMTEKSGTVDLKAGLHSIAVTYFDQGGDDGLVVSWQGPGVPKEKVPGRVLGSEAGDTTPDAALRALEHIPGRQKEKFADLAALVKAGGNLGGAVRALRRIDRAHWDRGEAPALVEAILAHVSALRPAERTAPAAVDALQLGEELAALLPAGAAAEARGKIKGLGVQILLIRPVPHQMLYDRRKIAVEAGRPVEILFENVDIMPHNLVVTQPGAMAEVGQLAEAMGPQGQERDFLPESKKILWATRLVQPGQSARLQFTAPAKPGSYPYVCTFPGHWLVMNGVMEVVPPGASTAVEEAAPASAARPFVRAWTLSDLEGEFASPARGRSFARGKEMFAAAGCAKCHAVAGAGAKIGPDLTRVSEKVKGKDLLRQILDPSSEIGDQFRAWVIQTTDDEVVAGLIVKEDDREIQVLTNPLEPDRLTALPKAKVKARKPSTLSSMPAGLLSTLSREEILDLVAFVESGGDPTHRLFK
jgi:putative heme-binding domain-containing protein